ncbi:rod shape-determining protein MreC [Anaerosinus sp.]|uniref:rod shape-determining protein MreC n=1 Tax=Selenobaculum sp. TaxID=3074374 RepID=UPI0015AF5C28
MSRARKDSYSNKKIIVLLTVFVIVFLLIFSSATGKYQFLASEKLVNTVLAPFQNVMMRISTSLHGAGASIWEIATVYKQNKMLMSENEQLRSKQIDADEILAENYRLRNMLAYKQATPQFDLLPAKIIARDSSTWTKSVTINCGSADGIAKDMTVITERGLVGNIASVTSNSAIVQLILDPRSAVGGLVQRPESRVAGIIEGNNNQAMAKMINIPRDADIQPSDVIVTSGFGGVYPKGVCIGTVEQVINEEGGLLKYAVLSTAVDFNKLEEVFVITKAREIVPLPSAVMLTNQQPVAGGAK